MTVVCPYCKAPLSGKAALPPMRMRWQRIYDAVLEAGPEGISTDDLLIKMYAENEWPTPGGFTVLRVSICDINKVLKPCGQRIINAFRKRYKLIGLEDKTYEEESQR